MYACNKRFTTGELHRIMIEKAKAEQKKGYCELCHVKYDNIDAVSVGPVKSYLTC